MRLATLLCFAFLLAAAARAQAPGDCALGQARADLAVSDVRATLLNTGSLFFGDGVQAGYVVPRRACDGNPCSPVFAAGIWIGGKVGGEVRVAGSRYANFEFWPGPLDEGATLPDPDDCTRYDRIWVVSLLDVQVYELTGEATPDLAEWPVGLGAPAVDAQGDPVVPTHREQVIDLEAGERPVVHGSQTAFWVMNDVGNDHAETGSDPLGVEVRVLAFAVLSAEPALNQATVYRYTVVNRNSQPLTDAYFNLFLDPDLGDAGDDYIGVDTTRGMAFTYNGRDSDSVYGIPPAVGYDFLSDGLGAHTYFVGIGYPMDDPTTAAEYYNRMQGLWNDGTPMTEGGTGYQTGGDVTTFAFPGDPVTGQFWSEVDEDNPPGDRRQVAHSPAFTLQPGEARTFDLAVVFAQGADYLDSITRLRAASDLVQARYDDGSLLEPGGIPDGDLPAPTLLGPPDGTLFHDEPAVLEWAPVAGAFEYLVQWSLSPNFPPDSTNSALLHDTSISVGGLPNEVLTYYWRVRAEGSAVVGPFSKVRSFVYYHYVYLKDWAGNGAGIVETAYPGIPDVCADAGDDPGCADYGGNTVFNDPNANSDYYLTASGNGLIGRLRRYVEAAAPYDYELRFTEAGGYGLSFGSPSDEDRIVVRVPFELWNVGDPDDPDDDLRMIPQLLGADGGDEPPVVDWFTQDPFVETAADGSDLPATNVIYWMMPDRPTGYARFEKAALASGGAGAAYVDTDDAVTAILPGALYVGDVSPASGKPCTHQGEFVSWCYRNDQLTGAHPGGTFGVGDPIYDPSDLFVYPVGRVQLVDLAGDGTVPPPGAVVRFQTTDPPPILIDDEPGGPEQPATFALRPPYPNPTRGRTVVPFVVPTPGRVRVAVYDVLGREVAVLAEGLHGAGAHEAVLDGAGLASGVYVVVLEGEAARATAKLTILR